MPRNGNFNTILSQSYTQQRGNCRSSGGNFIIHNWYIQVYECYSIPSLQEEEMKCGGILQFPLPKATPDVARDVGINKTKSPRALISSRPMSPVTTHTSIFVHAQFNRLKSTSNHGTWNSRTLHALGSMPCCQTNTVSSHAVLASNPSTNVLISNPTTNSV